MAETDTDLSSEQIASILLEINAGARIADVLNTSPETLEGLYALAYNLYNSASYDDALTVFKALTLYDHRDSRFWMGLAGCLQAKGEFQDAIEAYSMVGVSGLLSDPTPFLHAARCYLELGDKENAIGALKGLLVLGDESNPAHAACHEKASALLAILEKGA